MAEPLRLRVRLAKKGRARYLSHSEFSRTLMLAARRSGLPLHYSGDYRPHMKISLSPPLPIGIESECELVDFFMAAYASPAEAERTLGGTLPDGIEVVGCRLLGHDAKPVGKLIDSAAYTADIDTPAKGAQGAWVNAVEVFLEREVVEVERVQPRRTRTIDLRPGVHRLEVEKIGGEAVRITMLIDDGIKGTVKPREILMVLAGLAGEDDRSWKEAAVLRTGLYTRRGEKFISPMDLGRRKPAV